MKRQNVIKAVIIFLLVSLLLSLSPSAYALEKNTTGYTVVDSRQYPIIFIPGMAGSALDVGGAGTINVWPGSLSNSDAALIATFPVLKGVFFKATGRLGIVNDESFKVLALKKDGKTPEYGVRAIATDTVRHGLGDVYMIAGDWRLSAIYQGFYDYMEKEGYQFNEDTKGTGKVFFDFPYDFRQDNHRWTTLLDKKIDTVLRETKSDKVILVGHSMGGLQARLYMKDAGRAKKVAAVVFMGTPHHGAPMAFYSFTEGYNFGNAKLTDARMWEIAGNWEGGYQLLPDYPFILDSDDLSKPPLGLDAMLKENWISTQEYQHYLQAQEAGEKYTLRKGLPNNDFARKSLDFHKELGKSVDKYPGVKYYMIRGTKQETVEYLVLHWERIEGLPEAVVSFTKQMSPANLGDGTVQLKGALIEGLDEIPFDVESPHGDIPSNAEAQQILTSLRKKINNEDFRNALVERMVAFAETNIDKVRPSGSGSFSSDEGSLLSFVQELTLWFIRGTPDPEKIKLRDEIKEMTSNMVRTARANITITAGSEKDESGASKPEYLYIDIVDYEIKGGGTGIISGATMNIKVDSMATFEQALASTDALAKAWTDGKITIEGKGGLVNTLKGKIAKWLSKYVKFRL